MNREKWRMLLKAALKGNLLLVLGFDRYLDRIVYLFVCALVFIWINLGIDKTLHRKQTNQGIIENLQSMHVDITCKLTSLNSICTVDNMLEDFGSEVRIPTKKAKRIE